MEEVKVVEMNKERIVLSNNDIMILVNPTPVKDAFDKIQNASSVSGKTQYWTYRVWKKIIELHRDIDNVRIKLATDCCDKDEDGNPIFTDSQYAFEPEQRRNYDETIALAALSVVGDNAEPLTKEQNDAIAEQFCKRDKKGRPIKEGGNSLSMSEEGGKKFNVLFSELMKEENTLPFDKIKIDSALLEKMNDRAGANSIGITDMIMLEKIFEFSE